MLHADIAIAARAHIPAFHSAANQSKPVPDGVHPRRETHSRQAKATIGIVPLVTRVTFAGD